MLGFWRGRDRVASGRTSRYHGRTQSSGSHWRGPRAWSICHFPFAFESRSSIGPGDRRAKAGGARVAPGAPRAAGTSGNPSTLSLVVAFRSTPSCVYGQAALGACRPRPRVARLVYCVRSSPAYAEPRAYSKAPGPRARRLRSPWFAGGKPAARRSARGRAGTRRAGAEQGGPVPGTHPNGWVQALGAAEQARGEGRRIPDTYE